VAGPARQTHSPRRKPGARVQGGVRFALDPGVRVQEGVRFDLDPGVRVQGGIRFDLDPGARVQGGVRFDLDPGVRVQGPGGSPICFGLRSPMGSKSKSKTKWTPCAALPPLQPPRPSSMPVEQLRTTYRRPCGLLLASCSGMKWPCSCPNGEKCLY
jgi:hypothetical protein